MKIKRYIGKDTHEAMLKVRMDLGSDAIILNTRKIKQKGLTKLFSKPLVEVLAAIDEGVTQSKTAQKDDIVNQEKQKGNVQEKESLEQKVNKMEQMLNSIYAQLHTENDKISFEHRSKQQVFINRNEDKSQKLIQVFSKNLLNNNVNSEIIDHVVQYVKKNVTSDSNVQDIAANMYRSIISLLGRPQPIALTEESDRPKVVAFVGPTGAGKTTTLAKIAANFAIDHKKDIGIISADTYRIAAVEQLKTYAEILGVPVSVIYSSEEVQGAIQDFGDKDMILIDTAGRSHKHKQQFEELKRIIELGKPDEVFLLISLTTDYNVCKEIIDSYKFLQDYKMIFTKIDEAAGPGVMLNLRKLTDRQLSYVTTGQSVPDDIEVINVDKIAKKLLGSINV